MTGWLMPAAVHAISVLVIPPTLEPLTLEEGKLRAGLQWATGDPRDALMTGFIAAARSKVEQDTGLALLTQTRDVYFDRVAGLVITLPSQSLPLQSVTSVQTTSAAGVVTVFEAGLYVVDSAGGRLGLAMGATWPTDLRPFQPYVLRIVSGYVSVAAIPPLLVHAVGLLTAHYATLGRDLTVVGGGFAEVPMGYEDAIAPYRLVSLA